VVLHANSDIAGNLTMFIFDRSIAGVIAGLAVAVSLVVGQGYLLDRSASDSASASAARAAVTSAPPAPPPQRASRSSVCVELAVTHGHDRPSKVRRAGK
jgi:hypothetical protein